MDRLHHNDQLAVNKIGKKIKKTPFNQPKNGFRRIVPRLTSSQRQIKLPYVSHPAMAQPPLCSQPMIGHQDQFWSDITAQSPVSVCMPSLLADSRPHVNPILTPSFNGDGLLPSPFSVCIRLPQRNQMQPSHDYQPYQQPQLRNHHSPCFNGSASSVPILPSPRSSGRGILPTPQEVQYRPSSSMAQRGILGPGKTPQPHHAYPDFVFPPSHTD